MAHTQSHHKSRRPLLYKPLQQGASSCFNHPYATLKHPYCFRNALPAGPQEDRKNPARHAPEGITATLRPRSRPRIGPFAIAKARGMKAARPGYERGMTAVRTQYVRDLAAPWHQPKKPTAPAPSMGAGADRYDRRGGCEPGREPVGVGRGKRTSVPRLWGWSEATPQPQKPGSKQQLQSTLRV